VRSPGPGGRGLCAIDLLIYACLCYVSFLIKKEDDVALSKEQLHDLARLGAKARLEELRAEIAAL